MDRKLAVTLLVFLLSRFVRLPIHLPLGPICPPSDQKALIITHVESKLRPGLEHWDHLAESLRQQAT